MTSVGSGTAGGLAVIGQWIHRRCHLLYLALALPLVVWFAFWIPAFQNPDETAHFARADQISRGILVGTRFGVSSSGGWIDAAILQAQQIYARLPFNPEAKISVSDVAASRQIRWSGEPTLYDFRNTVNYGPLFYLPQASGVWLGRSVGLGVVDTLVLARVFNGLATCALVFLALRYCAIGKRVMFSVLMWPMTLSLSASSSHESLLIASAALMIALASRVSTEDRRATHGELLIFLIALVGGFTGRPPHLAFALLLPLLLPRRAPGATRLSRWEGGALAAAAVLCAAWLVLVQTYTMAPTLVRGQAEGPSVYGQLEFLRMNPGVIPSLVYQTMVLGWKPLITMTIGVLGWLDTLMPSWYYWSATAVFAAAVLADRRVVRRHSRRIVLLGWAAIFVFAVFTYASIYLTWMGVGANNVLGVQGRYLLAGVPLAAWLLPARHDADADDAFRSATWVIALSFVIVTYVVVPSQVVARYYGN